MRTRNSGRLAGRAVVVTGAASGIGRALVQELAKSGCPVAIADIDEAGLDETARSVEVPTFTRVLDVSSEADVNAFAAEVSEWLPAPLGAVFNNAGVAVSATVADGDPADDQWLHNINFHGVVNGTRAFLPTLIAQRSGAIVNTSSVYGLVAVPFHSAYCASKFAVRGYTESLRHELRDTGVRAVVVHPGGIKTAIARNARVPRDPEGLGRSADEMAKEFDAAAMTTPERAARIIHRGVDRGKARILVGPDAVFIDGVSRLAPTRAAAILTALEAKRSSTSPKAVAR